VIGYAQTPAVRFYPLGQLTYCKGCGHGRSDYWEMPVRLENHSPDALILYGYQYDDHFDFVNQIQRRSPDTCEWQYGNGRAINGGWEAQSDDFKTKFVLKPGESIDSTRGVNISGETTPTRWVAYVATEAGAKPVEIFSEPYVAPLPEGTRAGDLIAPVVTAVDEDCRPACALSLEQSPRVRGVRLGTTVSEFRKLFPKIKIPSKDKYGLRYIFIWDWNNDAFSTSFTFYRDEVARIETQFRSLQGKRWGRDFYPTLAALLGLGNFGTGYLERFECRDFLIDVIRNDIPTITIWNKSFIDFHSRIVEDSYRNK
jgi:hypothetical protein